MNKLNELLQSVPDAALIGAAVVAAFLVVLIVTWSFREGREISFWPPRIGPRPKASPPSPSMPAPPVQRSIPKPLPSSVRPSAGEALLNFERVDVDSLNPIEVLGQTNHSLIQKCLYKGRTVVLKRTREDICDLDAIQLLVRTAKESVGGWPEDVRKLAAIPTSVWSQGGLLWELTDFVEGMSLGDLVIRHGQTLNGGFLVWCTRKLVAMLRAMESVGLVHRDINPFNLMLTYSGELRLIDWTFCTTPGRQSTAIATKGYAAPEQEAGNAGFQSDWYSLGATLYFFGNGTDPPMKGTTEYQRGIENLYSGDKRLEFLIGDQWFRDHRPHWAFRAMCDGLLDPDPAKRQIPTRFAWKESTVVGGYFGLRVFDLGGRNNLLVTDSKFWVLPKELDGVVSALGRGLFEDSEDRDEVVRLVRLHSH